MKRQLICLFAVFSTVAASGQDLGTAFGRAEQIVRDSRPTSSGISERARDDRAERRASGGSQSTQPDWSAMRRAQKEREKEQKRQAEMQKRQAEERERQRIANNLSVIEAHLAAAASSMPPIPPHSYDADKSTATINVQSRRDWLQSLVSAPSTRPLGTYASDEKRQAFRNSQVVRDAIRRGEKPPFQPLWNYYEFNRSIAAGLVPDENRCAIVMSMTLGLEPQGNDASIASLTDKKQKSILLGLLSTKKLEEPVRNPAAIHTEVAARYYLRAEDLANRLKTEWGQPLEIDALDAATYLNGKQGVVFLEHAYLHPGTPASHPQGSYLEDPFKNFRKGDHIDLWKGNMNATDSTMPFQHAQKIWFWELK